VSYHPPVFSAMKRFVLPGGPGGGSQAASLILQCAAAGMAVYSPHTAADAVPGGLNDWLLGAVVAGAGGALSGAAAPVRSGDVPPAWVGSGAGDGRRGQLASALSLADVVRGVKSALALERVLLAGDPSAPVRSIAVCGGSGASVLAGAPADVLVTGEMGHHEVLAAAAAGSAVILTSHSNSERGWLPQLRERIIGEWAAPGGGHELLGTQLEVVISEVDADPLVSV